MKALFERLFRIRPDELGRVQAFFALYTTIGALYTFGATAGDSLFLAHVPRDRVDALLAWVYVGVALATVSTTWIFDRLQSRVPRGLLIAGTQVALALSVALLRLLLPESGSASPWLYYGLVIWLEVCALVSITLFFSLAGDAFTTRDAKRLYGYIAGGLSLGNFLAGAMIPSVVRAIGTANLLFVVAALLAASAALSWALQRVARRAAAPTAREEAPRLAPTRAVAAHPQVQLLFVVSLLGLACFVLVDYQMKISARAAFPEASALASFFGQFYSAVGMTQILFQFLLVGWLLRRLGIVACLAIMPTLHLVMAAAFYGTGQGLLTGHALWIITAANFFRMTVTETLEMPTRELALLPLSPRLRVRAQAMMSGMVAPLGQGVGGLLIVLSTFGDLRLQQLSIVVLGAAILWLVALARLRETHRETLSRSLRDNVIDAADLESLVRRDRFDGTARDLLARDDPALLRFTLDLLQGRPLGSLAPEVRALALHDDPTVAVKAVGLLAQDPEGGHVETLRRALERSRDDALRAEAVRALCRCLGADAVDMADPWLASSNAALRHAALEGLARWGEARGAAKVGAALDEMLASDDEAEVVAALGLCVDLGDADAVDRVIPALDHGSTRVVEAAISALGRLGHAASARRLVELAEAPALRRACAAALCDMPPDSADTLAELAAEPGLLPEVRSHLFHALAEMNVEAAQRGLCSVFREALDPTARVAAGRELQRLALAGTVAAIDDGEARAEVETILELLELLERVQDERGHEDDTSRMVRDRQWLLLECLFQALSLIHDPRALTRVRFNLDSPRPELRANALELLESTLPGRLGREVARAAEALLEPGRRQRQTTKPGESLADALASADPWLRVVALPPDAWSDEERALAPVREMVVELTKVPLFDGVPADALRRTARAVRERSLEAGAVLFEQGDPGESAFLVRAGTLSVVIDGAEVRRLGAGEVIGELAVLEGLPRSAGVVAVEACRLLEIAATDFEEMIRGHDRAARAIMRTLCARLRSRSAAASSEPGGGS